MSGNLRASEPRTLLAAVRLQLLASDFGSGEARAYRNHRRRTTRVITGADASQSTRWTVRMARLTGFDRQALALLRTL